MKRAILLLIAVFAMDILSAQTICNTRDEGIFIVLEHPPKPNLTDKELESNLNSLIDPSFLDSYKAEDLYVIFIVNCKGEDFNYRLFRRQDSKVERDSLSDFQQVFLSKMQLLLTWTPGTMDVYEKGKYIQKEVDCEMSYSFIIEGKRFHVLSEKEKRKKNKK